MGDRYVKALIYRVHSSPSIEYDRTQPLTCEEGDFRVTVECGKATFLFKRDIETEEEAREVVSEYIRHWEFSAGLRHGPDYFRLQLDKTELKEKSPVPGEVRVMDQVIWRFDVGRNVEVTLGPGTYPSPPSKSARLKVSDEVQTAFDHYMRYRQGRDLLTNTAYFCLTALEAAVPKQPKRENPNNTKQQYAASWFGISNSVLSRIRHVSSKYSGPQGRKGGGIHNDPTPEERLFLEKATETLIRRMAERAYAGDKGLPSITLVDLPHLQT